MMSVFACGNNTSEQILEGYPSILCCPSLMSLRGITHIEVTFSHILWKTQSGWTWTGYKCHDGSNILTINPGSKVFISENRTAAISNNGSAAVWEKTGWRALHFQKDFKEEAGTTFTCLPHTKTQKYLKFQREREARNNGSSLDCNLFQNEDYIKLPRASVEENDLQEIYSSDSWKRKELSDMQGSHSEKKSKLVDASENQDELCDADYSTSEPEGSEHQVPKTNTPQIVFCQVAVEDNVLLALDKDGVVYCGSVPITLGLKITEVAVGKEHCMALTADGDILTWGSGMRGQLGDGELCQKEKPLPVESLQGIIISSISCGGWHSVALSDSGDVYIWGWNENGQLGFPVKSNFKHSLFESFKHVCQCPKNLTIRSREISVDTKEQSNKETKPQSEYLSQCLCIPTNKGNGHDKVSLKEEKIFETTRKEQNLRLLDDRVNQDCIKDVINVQASPKLLDFWSENVKIVDVQCGDRHTLFQLDDGSAWSVGMNKYGQLGLGHTDGVEEPTEVFRRGVTKIYAGGWNSVFVTTN
ncbi:probable E3 ubiquitin-protein ligase HERC1 isoform X1 [Homarus americanus]|uniref:probable E3 ubiquitin-protein ligase HERC1 isoform X1 n=1 Tax=Homarus americanus TaxID=6706 RepID=UPI001C43A8DE|nr:probable E3 ubiquitin-protein ligase HERC1 isoform X1 [Homarus americanus]